MSRPPRVRESHRRDFSVYLRFRRGFRDRRARVDFCPWPAPEVERGEVDAMQAFVLHDATGRVAACRQPRAIRAALEGKRLLNWQIDQWAQHYADFGGRAGIELDVRPQFPWMPEWVWEAVHHHGLRLMAAAYFKNPPLQ